MALCLSTVVSIKEWVADTIDQIVILGNDLHMKSIKNFIGVVPDPPYLCAHDPFICNRPLYT